DSLGRQSTIKGTMRTTKSTFISEVLRTTTRKTTMRTRIIPGAALVSALEFTLVRAADIPPQITTPDKVETSLGTLEFKDGAPSAANVQKVYDNLDYIRGVDAFMNSFSGGRA